MCDLSYQHVEREMPKFSVTRRVCARIPTAYGDFRLCCYTNTLDKKEHLALYMGDLASVSAPLVRVHSECLTGDVLGSRRCDCGEQLDHSMAMVARAGIEVLERGSLEVPPNTDNAGYLLTKAQRMSHLLQVPVKCPPLKPANGQ